MRFLTIPASEGQDAIKVSKIVLGTDKLALKFDDKKLFYLYDQFVDAGGNCLDTARVYCGGLSEEAVGRWLSQTGKRAHIVLSSKGCHPPIDDMPHARLSYDDMRRDIEASLKALRTDYIDIYWLHRDDPEKSAGEIIENLNKFIKEGKIRRIGCSNWKTNRIEAANRYAAGARLCGFSSSQIQWSLAETSEEIYMDYAIVIMNKQEYDWYLKNKMPVFAYASQAQGFFPKMAEGGVDSLNPKVRARFLSSENLVRLEKVKALAAKLGISVCAASLLYITCNRLGSAAIIGPGSSAQLAQSLEAADAVISPEEASALRGE